MRKKSSLLIQELLLHPPILFSYLFGSRAKGLHNPRSDWDVAVFLSGPVEKYGRWFLFELEAKLSSRLGETVQILLLNRPFPPLLGFEIVKHGILLTDRNEQLRLDFENRVLRSYHDWRFFSERHMKADFSKANLTSHKNQRGPIASRKSEEV